MSDTTSRDPLLPGEYEIKKSMSDPGSGGNKTVVKDFIHLIRGLVPLLENVKFSIEESSNRIPKASSQLSKVSEATESATVEILNVLESMSEKISKAEKGLKDIRQLIPENSQTEEILKNAEKMLAETKDDSMTIAMALQVQDITSQQIAGVSHIIESVRTQLSTALSRFENGEDPDMPKEQKEENTHFDIDAAFSKDRDRQNDADAIVQQFTNSK